MKTKILLNIFLTIIIVCCTNPKSNNAEKPDMTYYQNEIINEDFIDLYGKWELKEATTGWGNLEIEFDYLEIVPFGSFSIIRNDSIILKGRIEAVIQDSNQLKIDFDTDIESSFELFKDSEKWIVFENKNKMRMVAPCCDRTDYLMKRK